MLKRALQLMAISLVALFAIGCSDTSTVDDPPVPGTLPTPFPGFTFPLLDLANSQIPLPNDLLRNPQTGNLNFPGTGEPFDAGNSLNGFSTSGAIIVPFRGTVVPETVTTDTLRVFNTATGQAAPMRWTVTDGPDGSVVQGLPVFALDHSTQYIVVVTNGIQSALSNSPILSDNAINILKGTAPLLDGNGNSTNAALDNGTAAALEPVRSAYQPIWAGAEQLTGTSRADIPLAFAFTTQTLFDVLPSLRTEVVNGNRGANNANPAFLADPVNNAAAQNAPVAAGRDAGPNLQALGVPTIEQFFANPQLPAGIPNNAIGRIHFGSVEVPVYRTDAANGFWANPPAQTGTRQVPFILFLPSAVAIPNAANPPVPAVVFQHGITGNKQQSLALANAVCSQNLGLLAIDLELHGDLRVDTNAADGDGFINVPNLRNSRDNIRQSVVNLYGLNNAIVTGQTNLDGVGGPELAPGPALGGANPSYIGLSLGSIVLDIFHATEPNVTASFLSVGGARISNLLLNSAAFRQPIVDGLAASGVQEGTPAFAQFFLIAQAVLDDADPVNYADQATSGALRGGTAANILQSVNTVDNVVPPVAQYDKALQHANGNAAFTQVDALAPQALIAQGNSPFQGIGFYENPANANHGALLDPTPPNPTVAIVTQALTYLGSALQTGTGTIADTNIRAAQAAAQAAEKLEDYARAVRF